MTQDAFFIAVFVVLAALALMAERFPMRRRTKMIVRGLLAVAAVLAALEVGGWTGFALIIGAVVLVDVWRLVGKRTRAGA
jgi:hypothetical protein